MTVTFKSMVPCVTVDNFTSGIMNLGRILRNMESSIPMIKDTFQGREIRFIETCLELTIVKEDFKFDEAQFWTQLSMTYSAA